MSGEKLVQACKMLRKTNKFAQIKTPLNLGTEHYFAEDDKNDRRFWIKEIKDKMKKKGQNQFQIMQTMPDFSSYQSINKQKNKNVVFTDTWE